MADLTSFRAHMDRCATAIPAPMNRPDIKVTIVVRAPEALPGEAMISTNDDLAIVGEALAYFAAEQFPSAGR